MRMFTYALYRRHEERGTIGGVIDRERTAELINDRGEKLVTRRPFVPPKDNCVKTVQLKPTFGYVEEYVRIRYE